MAYCAQGKTLLENLTRADWLPKYDEDALRLVLSEIASHREQAQLIGENDDERDRFFRKFLISCMQRNGRVLYAYHIHRLKKIREIRWVSGSVLPKHVEKAGILSTRENDFFSRYGDILSAYFEEVDLDLTADLVPPDEVFIHILVLEDCGEIVTDSGTTINLQRGMRQYIKRSIVEHFIREGKCKHVSEA